MPGNEDAAAAITTSEEVFRRISDGLNSNVGDLDLTPYTDFSIVQPVESCSTNYHDMSQYAFNYKFEEKATISVSLEAWRGSSGGEVDFSMKDESKDYKDRTILGSQEVNDLYDAIRKPIEAGEQSVTKILHAASVDARARIWVAFLVDNMLAYYNYYKTFDEGEHENGMDFIWNDTTWVFRGQEMSFTAPV